MSEISVVEKYLRLESQAKRLGLELGRHNKVFAVVYKYNNICESTSLTEIEGFLSGWSNFNRIKPTICKVNSFNDNHPELREDEYFYTNCRIGSIEDDDYKGRKGIVSYIKNGRVLEGYVPVFRKIKIKKSE